MALRRAVSSSASEKVERTYEMKVRVLVKGGTTDRVSPGSKPSGNKKGFKRPKASASPYAMSAMNGTTAIEDTIATAHIVITSL